MHARLAVLINSEQCTPHERLLMNAIARGNFLQRLATPGSVYEAIIAYADQPSRAVALMGSKLSPCRSIFADFTIPGLLTPSTLLFTKTAADLLRIVLYKITAGTRVYVPPVVCFGAGVIELGSICPGPSYWVLPDSLRSHLPKERLFVSLAGVKLHPDGSSHRLALALLPMHADHKGEGAVQSVITGSEVGIPMEIVQPHVEKLLESLTMGVSRAPALAEIMAATRNDLPPFLF